MKSYSGTFLWQAMSELFEVYPDRLVRLLNDESDDTLKAYFMGKLNYSDYEFDEALRLVENLAYRVTITVDDDFNRLLFTVKNSTELIRGVFTPKDARILIDAFEESRTPELTQAELITGIYLVVKGGERDIPGFDALATLAEVETP